MQVASLELCKELYEVSGWDDTDAFYTNIVSKDAPPVYVSIYRTDPPTHHQVEAPAYDAGYLLRKLPSHVSGNLMLEADGTPVDRWCAYYDAMPVTLRSYYNDTPEDALCKLAIELFKQGVLTNSQEETR